MRAPFSWDGDHIAADLGVARALFTTRRGGVSQAPFDTLNLGLLTDDDPANIRENRERLRQATGTDKLLQGRQVHGAVVERVGGPGGERPEITGGAPGAPAAGAPHGGEAGDLFDGTPGELTEADGQATALKGLAAVVLTADCLPIAIASPCAVAMVHAGWKGLAGGVVEEGVAAVLELGGEPAGVVAAIGPGACGRCYEVGDEVREAFGIAPVGGPQPIDLKAIAREKLEAAGVTVHDVELCTIHDDPALFFSHRRDHGRTGRQAGAVWR